MFMCLLQLFRSSEIAFRKYDFGTDCDTTVWKPHSGFQPKPWRESCNQEKYGSRVPPEYDLVKIRTPQVYFIGKQ